MGARNKKMFRDGQMRAALDHEAQARVAHQRNAAWKGLHAPAGFARVERYQTADPTLSLATVQDGRPVYDFAAAPSLFVEEDLRQEKHMLGHSLLRLAGHRTVHSQNVAALRPRATGNQSSPQPSAPVEAT